MEQNNKRINICIKMQRYPLLISNEDEQLFFNAEKMINQLIAKYENWQPNLSVQNHLSLALLDLAYQYLKIKDKLKVVE